MTIKELFDQLAKNDGFGRLMADNPSYQVYVEVRTPVEGVNPDDALLTLVGVRWEHNDQMLVLETE